MGWVGVAGRAELSALTISAPGEGSSAAPDALSSQSPNHGSVPSGATVSPCPPVLFGQTDRRRNSDRQTHGQRTLFWVVDFLYINKENQNTSKDDSPPPPSQSISRRRGPRPWRPGEREREQARPVPGARSLFMYLSSQCSLPTSPGPSRQSPHPVVRPADCTFLGGGPACCPAPLPPPPGPRPLL